MSKFVFVTGGVVSSIGKGIVAASLGRLLKLSLIHISEPTRQPTNVSESQLKELNIEITIDE